MQESIKQTASAMKAMASQSKLKKTPNMKKGSGRSGAETGPMPQGGTTHPTGR